MDKNRAVKTGLWLAVLISSLLLLVFCTMYFMQGGLGMKGFAKEKPCEAIILTEPCLFLY